MSSLGNNVPYPRTEGIGAGRKKEQRAIPGRFHFSTDKGGVRQLEITNCDFKLGRSA